MVHIHYTKFLHPTRLMLTFAGGNSFIFVSHKMLSANIMLKYRAEFTMKYETKTKDQRKNFSKLIAYEISALCENI